MTVPYYQKITNNYYNTSQRLSIVDSEENDECIRLTNSMMWSVCFFKCPTSLL